MARLEFIGVEKMYGPIQAVKPLNLLIEAGMFTVLVGPSGCGKTTLLRMIAGLESITRGEIFINGKRINDIKPRYRNVSMVFQNYALYPHMTVKQNIGLPLRIQKVPGHEIRQRVEQVAGVLGLQHLLGRKPKQLSGGECQRVALGRAMVRKPDVFLLDEPLSNLDAKLREEMRRELLQLHARLGVTMIYVTHDQIEAMTMAEQMVVMKEGELQQVGKPFEVYHQPVNIFVAGFIGSPPMFFTKSSFSQKGDRYVLSLGKSSFTLPAYFHSVIKTKEVIVGMRPEDIVLKKDKERKENWLSLNVITNSIQPTGHLVIIEFVSPEANCNGTALVSWRDNKWKPGESASANIDMGNLYLFHPDTGERLKIIN